MARKFLYLIAALVVLVIGAMIAMRIWSRELTEFAFVPRTAFEQQAGLPRESYADASMWLSRPGLADDPARFLPTGAQPGGAAMPAAVFFIHPTSYLARDHWNGPLDDVDSQRRAKLFVRGMASAFNASEQLWVPRYRQAAFGAFLTDRPEAQRALDLAYADVQLAFDAFVTAIPADVPVVLAGHSQGALHLMHLLRDKVKGTPLATRVVAAYAVGWPISVDHDLPAMGFPACANASATGCVMSWASFAEPADPGMLIDAYRARPGLDGQPKGTAPPLCTNPLTGGTGGTAPKEANIGTLVPSDDYQTGTLAVGAVPARCGPDGLLLIGDPPDLGPYVLPGNNYHVYDIPLFWANLRVDVAARVKAWQDGRGAAR